MKTVSKQEENAKALNYLACLSVESLNREGVGNLMNMCAEAGLRGYSRKRKSELISMIEAATEQRRAELAVKAFMLREERLLQEKRQDGLNQGGHSINYEELVDLCSRLSIPTADPAIFDSVRHRNFLDQSLIRSCGYAVVSESNDRGSLLDQLIESQCRYLALPTIERDNKFVLLSVLHEIGHYYLDFPNHHTAMMIVDKLLDNFCNGDLEKRSETFGSKVCHILERALGIAYNWLYDEYTVRKWCYSVRDRYNWGFDIHDPEYQSFRFDLSCNTSTRRTLDKHEGFNPIHPSDLEELELEMIDGIPIKLSTLDKPYKRSNVVPDYLIQAYGTEDLSQILRDGLLPSDLRRPHW